MNVPKELRYTVEHEWIQGEGSKVRIGITDFAQSELGEIVFVELPETGTEVTANEPFGTVESVKAVSELYAPVSGRVVEVNKSLIASPEYVNDSPYGDGWMIVVELSDNTPLDSFATLITAEDYEKIVTEG